jgi:hypothetical protein
MTTEDALLALSEDQENAKALLQLGMNERQAIEEAAGRWFVDRNEAHLAFYSILPLLALNAKSYDPRIHDAQTWVEEQAALNARHLYIHKTANKSHHELIFLLRAEWAPIYHTKRGDFCTSADSEVERGTTFSNIERLTSQ